MDKANMLIKFNHAFMAYRNFLHQEGNYELYSDNNIDQLLLLFSCLAIILEYDKIQTKDENPNEYIDEDILSEIISVLSTKQNNLYYIDNIAFSSIDEIMKMIRNKIAHGDFYIDDDASHIVINYKEQEVKIPTKDFVSFAFNIVSRINLYTHSKKYSRNQIYGDSSKAKHVDKVEDIDTLLANIYHIDYIFDNEKGIRPYQKAVIEEALKKMPMLIKDYEDAYNTRLIEAAVNTNFQFYNIEVKSKIKSLINTESANTIKSFILHNFEAFRALDTKSQISLVSNWYYKIIRDNNPQEVINESVYYNMFFLTELNQGHYLSFADAMEHLNTGVLHSCLPEMILTNELLGFYIHYQYPLENLCKSKDNIDGLEYFDCGKLDLSMVNPSIYKEPQGRAISYEEEYLSTQKKLDSISDRLYSLTSQQKAITEKLKDAPNSDVQESLTKALSIVTQNINALIDEQLQEQANLDILEKNLQEFEITSKSGYRYNRYIIEYIRNAISHGNVHFSYNDSNARLEDFKLRFQNIHEGEVLFDLTISLPEFEKLFSKQNIDLLDEFIRNFIAKNKGKAV